MTLPGRSPVPAIPPWQAAGPLELFISPVRRWRTLLAFAIGATVVSAVISLILPARYQATASFITEEVDQPRLPQGLASLAGQFGIQTTTSGLGSAEFYADLVRSRSVLRAVLQAYVPNNGQFVRTIDLLGTRDEDSLRRVERAEEELSHRIDVNVDRTTRRIDVSVWMERPETAKAVADSLLSMLNRFDRDVRRTHAGEKRAFAERERASAADSLRVAEDAMARFLERNKSYQQSAELGFERERLARAISLRQDVYVGLAREAEEARINEVDNRPILTVIDPPVLPAVRAWPKRKLIVLSSACVALACVWLYLVLRQLAVSAVSDGDSDATRAVGVLRDVLHGPGARPHDRA